MNSVARKRLFWKESRELAPIFGLMTVCLLVAIAAIWSLQDRGIHGGALEQFLGVIRVFACIFALLTGACLFAPEQEKRTSEFLQFLPVSNLTVSRVKIHAGALFLMVFSLICGIAIVAYSISTANLWTDLKSITWPVWIQDALLVVECFLFGVIWSMMLPSTFLAISIAIVSVVFTTYVTRLPFIWEPRVSYFSALLKLPVISGLLFAIFVMSKPWSDSEVQVGKVSNDAPLPPVSTHIKTKSSRLTNPRLVRSLFWQSFRHALPTLVFCFGLLLAILCILIYTGAYRFDWIPTNGYILCLFPAITGLCVFTADQQKKSYRFFQQHSEHGRWLWLARLVPFALVSFGVIALIGVFHTNSIFIDELRSLAGRTRSPLSLAEISLLIFSVFAVGQFFSMFVASSLLAGFCAFIFGVVALFWALVVYAFGANPWMFVFPIPFVLLLSTWLAAPDWLAERTLITRAIAWTVVLCLPVGLFGGFVFHRSHDIEQVAGVPDFVSWNLGSDLDSELQNVRFSQGRPVFDPRSEKDEQLFRKQFYSLRKAIVGYSEDELEKFVTNNSATFDTVRTIANNPNSKIRLSFNRVHKSQLFGYENSFPNIKIELVYVILDAKRKLHRMKKDVEGELDCILTMHRVEQKAPAVGRNPKALRHLISWSEQPDVNLSLIEMALDACQSGVNSRSEIEREDALEAREEYEFVATELDWSNANLLRREMPWQDIFGKLKFATWELDRRKRDAQHRVKKGQYLKMEAFLKGRYWGQDHDLDDRSNVESYTHSPEEYIKYRPFLRPQNMADWCAMRIREYRYTRIRLALAAWRIEHGEYPRELSLLKEYLGIVPYDTRGVPFAYSAKGLEKPVLWNGPNHLLRTTEMSIGANTPFLLPFGAPLNPQLVSRTIESSREETGPGMNDLEPGRSSAQAQWQSKADDREVVVFYDYGNERPGLSWTESSVSAHSQFSLPQPAWIQSIWNKK